MKFILDTNLYIEALRDPPAAEVFQEHYRNLVPFVYMSSVVVQEILAGAASSRHARQLEREVLQLFERTGRIVAPSHAAWKQSGHVLAAFAREEGLELGRVPKSFVNDILIALSCRESGLTLITENARDFARIRKAVVFDFVSPWPAVG